MRKPSSDLFARNVVALMPVAGGSRRIERHCVLCGGASMGRGFLPPGRSANAGAEAGGGASGSAALLHAEDELPGAWARWER